LAITSKGSHTNRVTKPIQIHEHDPRASREPPQGEAGRKGESSKTTEGGRVVKRHSFKVLGACYHRVAGEVQKQGG